MASQGSSPHPSPCVETISGFPRIHTGVEDTSNTTPLASNPVITEQKPTGTDDPFANQRGSEEGPFSNGGTKEHLAVEPEGRSSEKADRRLSSDEWGLCF